MCIRPPYLALLLFSTSLAHAAPVPITARVGFEKNQGQFRPDILYAFRPGAYLTADSIVLSPYQVSMQFAGGNPAPPVSPSDTLPYLVNVFSGSDPTKWFTGIQRFGQVRCSSVYPGIDVVFDANQPFFTFRMLISPGVNPAAIRLSYTGAFVSTSPFFNTLLIGLQPGRIGQSVLAFQDSPAGRLPVTVTYNTLGTNLFGITLGTYDAGKPLMIECTLPLAGSAGFSGNYALPTLIAHSGSMFAASTVSPLDEPCANPINPPLACTDVAIYKFSAAGDLKYVTYLQGALQETSSAIAADDADALYITGETDSVDFPVTADASQRTFAGPPFTIPGDVFAAKLDAGGKLVYSTYLGGPEADRATAIALDAAGNAYIGGPSSAGLPVTPGALKITPCMITPPGVVNVDPQPCPLGYLAKVDSRGRIVFLTYLPAAPTTFTVDAQGNSYFAGAAQRDLPTTPGAFQTQPTGDRQAFLAKLNPSGTSLVYATYYTALTAPGVDSIAVDGAGNLWFSGPGSPNVDPHYQAFLGKLSADGARILYETPFIGGRLAVDPAGNLSVYTRSYGSQIVRTPGGLLTSACAPLTISKLAPDGAVLFNRGFDEAGPPLALNADGNLIEYLNLAQFGTAVDLISPASTSPPDAACMLNAASLSIPQMVAPGEIVTFVGRGIGPLRGIVFTLDPQGRVPNSLGGVQVLFGGVPAPVLYADDGQVNAIAPFSLTPGTPIAIRIQYNGRSTPPLTVQVSNLAPALFSRDASGGGQVLAFNQDSTLNGPSNPAQLGSIITAFATGIGVTSPASVEGAVANSIDARPVTAPNIILAGGIPTQILYAGPSPGSLTSVTQFNLRLPTSLPLNTFPLSQWPILFFNGAITQLLTIALKP